MKNFFFFLLFVLYNSLNVQTDSLVISKKSVISLDKVRTIYRGIENPISVAVTDCKSFTVEGTGVREVSKGKYAISPGAGTEAKIVITITNFDDTVLVEEHVFKIGNIPNVSARISNQNCYNCIIELSKEEIKNSIITTAITDFKFDLDLDGETY